MEEEDVELNAALAALRKSPLVRDVKPLLIKKKVDGYYATLWCSCEHPERKSEQLQRRKERDLLGCATELLTVINTKHGGHL